MKHDFVQRSLGLHVRGVSEKERTAEFVASTDALDSYGEVVEQVWILDRFKSNPVILYAHNQKELPIGKCIYIAVEKGQLICNIQFASKEANPLAENVWQSVLEQTLRAVSVGFHSHSFRWEKKDNDEYLVLSDNELMEISVVPIPANPEAVLRERAALYSERKRKNMDHDKEELMKARLAKEAAEAELAKANKQLAESSVKLAGLSERESSLTKSLEESKTKADSLEKSLKEANDKIALFEKEAGRVSEQLTAQIARAEKAEHELVVREVKSALGDTVLPPEVEHLVELSKASPALFRSEMDRRQKQGGMGLTEKQIATTPETGAVVPNHELEVQQALKARGV